MAAVHHKSDQKFSLPAVSKRYIHCSWFCGAVTMDVEIAVFNCTPACLRYCWGKTEKVDAIQGKTLFAPRCDMSTMTGVVWWWCQACQPLDRPQNGDIITRVPTWLRATVPSSPLSGCGLDDDGQFDGVHTGEEEIWSVFWELLGNSVVPNWDHLSHIRLPGGRKAACLLQRDF